MKKKERMNEQTNKRTVVVINKSIIWKDIFVGFLKRQSVCVFLSAIRVIQLGCKTINLIKIKIMQAHFVNGITECQSRNNKRFFKFGRLYKSLFWTANAIY